MSKEMDRENETYVTDLPVFRSIKKKRMNKFLTFYSIQIIYHAFSTSEAVSILKGLMT